MGDFNAKIGMDNTGYEDIMGTHGLGQMNENGERFCRPVRPEPAGDRRQHLLTQNQIDHICTSCKFRTAWRDVQVMRGADVSSDHHLLMTTVERMIIIKLPKKETIGTAETTEGSCSCQRQERFSTGFYWRGWRRLTTPSSETSMQASGKTDPVPTRSPACASSWNSHWSGTPPSTSTS